MTAGNCAERARKQGVGNAEMHGLEIKVSFDVIVDDDTGELGIKPKPAKIALKSLDCEPFIYQPFSITCVGPYGLFPYNP